MNSRMIEKTLREVGLSRKEAKAAVSRQKRTELFLKREKKTQMPFFLRIRKILGGLWK